MHGIRRNESRDAEFLPIKSGRRLHHCAGKEVAIRDHRCDQQYQENQKDAYLEA